MVLHPLKRLNCIVISGINFPAYAQDSMILFRVFQSSTDASAFEEFIEELLRHCGRWPEPKSILVMDNASFNRSERLNQICS